MPERDVLGNAATEADFEIVRMGTEDEEVCERHGLQVSGGCRVRLSYPTS
jgi:hypothetical protein